jgi:hypothetical protein
MLAEHLRPLTRTLTCDCKLNLPLRFNTSSGSNRCTPKKTRIQQGHSKICIALRMLSQMHQLPLRHVELHNPTPTKGCAPFPQSPHGNSYRAGFRRLDPGR